MFGPKINGNTVLPVFQLLVELANSVKQLSIRLLGGLGRVEFFVYFARDDGKGTHQSEKVGLALAISQGNVADVIRRVFTREFHIHVIIILDGRPS